MQLTSHAVPAVVPCCGPAGVKQDTLDRLCRIAQQAPDLPCFATVKPQWGLRRLLAEGFRPAQLCKRAGVSGRVTGSRLLLRWCRRATQLSAHIRLLLHCKPTRPVPCNLLLQAAALVGEALTLRTTCRLKKDDACGWLSGVLTEAGCRVC